MDLVTGSEVTVAVVVPVSRERMWELVTAVERIGEWSPEVTSASWCDESREPGARFVGYNRFPGGFEASSTCVVVTSRQPEVFAWDVLDDAGVVGSAWRYELSDGSTPGTTVVRNSFRHGPGRTGARVEAEGAPGERLATLSGNMISTITAMVGATR